LHHGLSGSFLEYLFLQPHWQRWDIERLAEVSVYEELAAFPLPRAVTKFYDRHNPQYGPTLLTLLSAWFGSPNNQATPLDRALLLFAAACVVVGPLQRENPAYRPWWNLHNSKLRDAFRLRLGSNAWHWIRAQLPDRVFHADLEGMLRAIPYQWARAIEAKGADSSKADAMGLLTPDELKELREELGEVIYQTEEEKPTEAEGYASA
jgi:hypothetical protein